jgi:hypothetical protein
MVAMTGVTASSSFRMSQDFFVSCPPAGAGHTIASRFERINILCLRKVKGHRQYIPGTTERRDQASVRRQNGPGEACGGPDNARRLRSTVNARFFAGKMTVNRSENAHEPPFPMQQAIALTHRFK